MSTSMITIPTSEWSELMEAAAILDAALDYDEFKPIYREILRERLSEVDDEAEE